MLHRDESDLKQTLFYQDVLAEGQLSLLLRQLTRRFGPLNAQHMERLRTLSTSGRGALAEALLDFDSAADLDTWLDRFLHDPPETTLDQFRTYQEGFEEGCDRGEIDLIIHLLGRRFGSLDTDRGNRIRTLFADTREALAEAMFDFKTSADIDTWLDANGPWDARRKTGATRALRYSDLKHTRFYQEAFADGFDQGLTDVFLQDQLPRLTEHLGPLGARRIARIRALSAANRDNLAEALPDFQSAADLDAWLDTHAPAP
jgi:predicted transposase YdaD